MSEENVEIARRAIDAFNRGDLDGAVANVAPDCEYITSGAIPGMTGVYRGRDGAKRFMNWVWEEFDDPQIEVHEITDAGDQVLVSFTNRGRGKQSGAEVSWHVWQVGTFRDGQIVRGQGFTNREDALKAAGLQE